MTVDLQDNRAGQESGVLEKAVAEGHGERDWTGQGELHALGRIRGGRRTAKSDLHVGDAQGGLVDGQLGEA